MVAPVQLGRRHFADARSSMNIVFIAPLPPPITGQHVASQVLLEGLKCSHTPVVVNLATGSKNDGSVTAARLLAVWNILREVYSARKRGEVAYLTISETVAGNLKDLFIYFLLGKLLGKTAIHLHGGSFKKQIIGRSPLLRKLNQYFLSRIGAAVISGPSHIDIFDGLVAPDRIKTIPNFAQDFMFAPASVVARKFEDESQKIRILYVSGMTAGKGYLLLLDAFEQMSAAARSRYQLDFAGRFDSEEEQARFRHRIQAHAAITYHGIISDAKKAELFSLAHIFCLPTSYMEGQPISILEAYASGCVVLSTPRPGILDIFEPLSNGFLISSEDPMPLRLALEKKCQDLSTLRRIGFHNREEAEEKFGEKIYCERVESVLNNIQ